MCAGNPVVVVGGGNSKGQAAVFLADQGSDVMVVIRGRGPPVRASALTAGMSRYLVDRLEGHPRISILTQTSVAGPQGGEELSRVRVAGPKGDETPSCAALLSFIGADPTSAWLSGRAALDGRDFVLTDLSLTPEHLDGGWKVLGRDPLPFETSWPGLFAVGVVRSGSTKRVAAVVGEGSAGVRSVHAHLAFVARGTT